MNPIIETIDQGHWSHEDRCQKCKTAWPCAFITKARRDNETYNETYLPPMVKAQGPIEPHKDHL